MTYRKQSTPKGYRHIWYYRGKWDETKLSPKVWKIDFRATKKKKSKSYGSFKKGFGVVWKINGTQHARKTGKGHYITRLIGTKRLIKTKSPRY